MENNKITQLETKEINTGYFGTMENFKIVQFETKDVINKDYFENIKNTIECSKCLNIISDPVQCDKCQHCFCSYCAYNLKCPYGCQFNRYIPSELCKQLLSKLIIKCDCGNELNYDLFNTHIGFCTKANYRKMYYQLKKKHDWLIKKINTINNTIINEYTIKSSLHIHPIACVRFFLKQWVCSHCNNNFYDDSPSYICTLCNFNLCYNCAKNTITKGRLNNEMNNYYQSKPKILTQYSTMSHLHPHPVELVKRMEPEWFCDNCKKTFNKEDNSFRCTLCDFDLCYDCAKNYADFEISVTGIFNYMPGANLNKEAYFQLSIGKNQDVFLEQYVIESIMLNGYPISNDKIDGLRFYSTNFRKHLGNEVKILIRNKITNQTYLKEMEALIKMVG